MTRSGKESKIRWTSSRSHWGRSGSAKGLPPATSALAGRRTSSPRGGGGGRPRRRARPCLVRPMPQAPSSGRQVITFSCGAGLDRGLPHLVEQCSSVQQPPLEARRPEGRTSLAQCAPPRQSLLASRNTRPDIPPAPARRREGCESLEGRPRHPLCPRQSRGGRRRGRRRERRRRNRSPAIGPRKDCVSDNRELER